MIEKAKFQAKDGVWLDGLLYLPKTESNHTIVISIHGMTSNCFGKRDETIARKVNQAGYSYLAFNNRGQDLSKYIRTEKEGKKENSRY